MKRPLTGAGQTDIGPGLIFVTISIIIIIMVMVIDIIIMVTVMVRVRVFIMVRVRVINSTIATLIILIIANIDPELHQISI